MYAFEIHQGHTSYKHNVQICAKGILQTKETTTAVVVSYKEIIYQITMATGVSSVDEPFKPGKEEGVQPSAPMRDEGTYRTYRQYL